MNKADLKPGQPVWQVELTPAPGVDGYVWVAVRYTVAEGQPGGLDSVAVLDALGGRRVVTMWGIYPTRKAAKCAAAMCNRKDKRKVICLSYFGNCVDKRDFSDTIR